jgi:hypothetical protein
MTAPRRPWKLRSLALPLLATAASINVLAGSTAIRAATTEHIVLDRNSGLAIGGFDPVAYFVDAAATLGRGDFEYGFAGAVWRLRNQGNRAAFIADPDVYLRRYGGYDPTAIARGGDPR